MSDPGLVQEKDGDAIAVRLREELARRRISRQALADMAKISLSTLEKALSGNRHFTLATVIRLEEALGTPLRETAVAVAPPSPGIAPEHMGSYGRAAVRWIEADYVTLRPSFDAPGAIYAYRTSIFWDDALGHLGFAESQRVDGAFAQKGHVAMPNLSGHTYLVTSESGQQRMIILGRATREGQMFGLLTTLQVGAGSQLVPVACPIAFVPQSQITLSDLGLMPAEHPDHDTCRLILDRALNDDFCRLRS